VCRKEFIKVALSKPFSCFGEKSAVKKTHMREKIHAICQTTVKLLYNFLIGLSNSRFNKL
jgi:hypothetical protein